eukprot:scaffold22642_cov134-Cylindrotheca_fusiformis.AAC.8
MSNKQATPPRDDIISSFMPISSMSLRRISLLYLVLIVACWIFVLSLVSSRNQMSVDSPTRLKWTTEDEQNSEPLAIVVGLPKSGTTSIFHYFSCNGIDTTHYCCCGSKDTQYPCQGGRLMSSQIWENVRAGRSLLNGIVGRVHAQMDGELFLQDEPNEPPYFLPQHFHLTELHHAAPDAIWILPLRSADGWKRSVSKWLDMGERIQKTYQSHYPNFQWTDDSLVQFYDLHTEHIRQACRRLQRNCLEVPVDDTAGQVLEDAFPGTRAACWGRHNGGPFFQVVEPP